MIAARKRRLDQLLFERGLAPDLVRAQSLIRLGRVLVDEVKLDKPGTLISPAAQLRLLGSEDKYVSRGGLKLEAALTTFKLDISAKRALDVGASTGGFTDCLLQAGAAEVWAVDVGYGQLAEKLRTDARVHNIERTNIREVPPKTLPLVDVIVIDASFISLRVVLPSALRFLAPAGDLVALIKPQFEVAKGQIEAGGVVTDPDKHRQVLAAMKDLAHELGLSVEGIIPSPITGQKKHNVEFLLWARRQDVVVDRGESG